MVKFKFRMSSIWSFLLPFVQILLTKGGLILATVAMQAVQIVAESMKDEDGTDKREAAFDIIKKELTEQGIDLASSVINAAIEAAVIKLKATE